MKHEFEDPRVAKKFDLEHIYLAIVSSQYNRLQELCEICILENEYEEITRLLAMTKATPPTLEDIRRMMDFVWDEIGCDNKKYDLERLKRFYNHPIWLLNGLFIENDPVSKGHRKVIAEHVCKLGEGLSILEYGGGFGTLAREITRRSPEMKVDILEPNPSRLALKLADGNIRFITDLNAEYDCCVCMDVLEHVPDPLKTLSEMISSVKKDGHLLIANCFYPVIKCHLPDTFHLRNTFRLFTRLMGLKRICNCEESHAVLYRKESESGFDWGKLRYFEKCSKALHTPFYPIYEIVRFGLRTARKAFS
jgi:2-polyprenyl-3-methyl-5-hydroxy-6-metoxy-1,4-benzoquinol methylase